MSPNLHVHSYGVFKLLSFDSWSLHSFIWCCQDHQSTIFFYSLQIHKNPSKCHFHSHFYSFSYGLSIYIQKPQVGQICYSWLLVNIWHFGQLFDQSQLTLPWPPKIYFNSFYHRLSRKSLFHWFFHDQEKSGPWLGHRPPNGPTRPFLNLILFLNLITF